MENISINGSAKQSFYSIHGQPWHVVKMITFLKIIMTYTQNTVNKHSFPSMENKYAKNCGQKNKITNTFFTHRTQMVNICKLYCTFHCMRSNALHFNTYTQTLAFAFGYFQFQFLGMSCWTLTVLVICSICLVSFTCVTEVVSCQAISNSLMLWAKYKQKTKTTTKTRKQEFA